MQSSALVQPQAKDQLEPLFKSIDAILAGQPTPLSYQHITAFCQTVVLQDRDAASRLSDKCTSSIEQYTERIRRELKGGILAKDRNTLGKLCESWQVWTARTVSNRSCRLISLRLTFIPPRIFSAHYWFTLTKFTIVHFLTLISCDRERLPNSSPSSGKTL